jgi:hypothetical protein
MRNRQVYGNAERGAGHLAQQHKSADGILISIERFCVHHAVIPIEDHDRLHRRAYRSARPKALNLLYEVPAHDQLSVPALMAFLGLSKQAHEN